MTKHIELKRFNQGTALTTGTLALPPLVIEGLAEFNGSFDRLCLKAGTAAIEAMLAADAEQFCGKRYQRHADRQGYRWGLIGSEGAPNEAISDIFVVIMAHFSNPDTRNWNWKVGEGLNASGTPFRDMSDPPSLGQPDHMNNYVVRPNTKDGDYGGVHANSGIHNKAAFNILTSVEEANNVTLSSKAVAAIFYLTLTQQSSRTSQFADSRRGALISAQTLFRMLAQGKNQRRVAAPPALAMAPPANMAILSFLQNPVSSTVREIDFFQITNLEICTITNGGGEACTASALIPLIPSPTDQN